MYPDTEETHKRDCLARHICTIGSVEQRREFIARLQLRSGESYAKDIQERVKFEWEKRRDAAGTKNNQNPWAEAVDLLRAESRSEETALPGETETGE